MADGVEAPLDSILVMTPGASTWSPRGGADDAAPATRRLVGRPRVEGRPEMTAEMLEAPTVGWDSTIPVQTEAPGVGAARWRV